MNPLYLFACALVLLAIPAGMKARSQAARGRRDLAVFEAARVVLSVVAALIVIAWATWGRPA